MDEGSVLKWGLESAKQIQQWDSRILLVDEYPMFKKMKKGLDFKKRIGTLLSDHYKIMSMVHLRFLE